MKYIDPDGLQPTSQQGQSTLQRAVDDVALFLREALNAIMGRDAEDDAGDREATAREEAEAAAEGIPLSLLPGRRQKQYQDAVDEAHATVGAGIVVAGATVAEQAVINRVVRIITLPGGGYIGQKGSTSSIRELPGGTLEAGSSSRDWLRVESGIRATTVGT